MKKSIITLVFAMIATFALCQTNMNRHFFRHKIDIKKYEVVDSLPIERIYIPSIFDYDEDKVITTGYGEYLIEAPHKDKMIIRTDKDRTKAIVVYNSFVFGRHMEYNIKESDKRLVLWYKDDNLFCGYTYDKRYNVCKYFEEFDKTKFEELRKHLFENMPRPPFRFQEP